MNSSEHLNNIFKRKKKRKLAEVEEIKKDLDTPSVFPYPEKKTINSLIL